MPFCPSLPWCFPIRELPFEQKEQQEQKQQQQQQEAFCCREVIFSMMFSNLGTGCKGGQKS